MKGHTSFHASRAGKCRGCGKRYRPGDNIWSPGKGGGAYHIKCQPVIETRQATAEDMYRIQQRSQLKRRGIYT